MQFIKRKRRCQTDQCLRPNSSKYDIKLTFCPKFQRDPLPPEHIYPEFNDDGKYYTSAFILGVDRKSLIKNEQQQIMDHQKQVRDSLQKHNQLIFPRPNSKHTHCSVCKQHYKNYYIHIYSEDHKQKISLSSYNQHIKTLCSQQKADQQAQKLAIQQQQRRKRLTDITSRDNQYQDDSSSLLDVQRGQKLQNYDQQNSIQQNYTKKSQKKIKKNQYINDDTLQDKFNKKKTTQRTYQSQFLKRKFITNNPMSADRLYRQQQQRKYERQRQKLKVFRDIYPTKQLIKMPQNEDDVFIIMRAQIKQLKQLKQQIIIIQNNNNNNNQFVWKKSVDKIKKDIQFIDKIDYIIKKQIPNQIINQNKKYQIYVDKKQDKNNNIEIQKIKYQQKSTRYPYSEIQYKNSSKNHYQQKSKQQHYNFLTDNKNQQIYKHQYYNYPCIYPPYQHFSRPDHLSDKDRNKDQKNYQYPPPYQWPYPHYYMPSPPTPTSITHIQPNTDHNYSKSVTSTNININFPMYMYPPSFPSHQRYPPAHTPSNYMPPPPYDYPYHNPNHNSKNDSNLAQIPPGYPSNHQPYPPPNYYFDKKSNSHQSYSSPHNLPPMPQGMNHSSYPPGYPPPPHYPSMQGYQPQPPIQPKNSHNPNMHNQSKF